MSQSRKTKRSRLQLEPLESRQLLSGDHLGINEQDLTRLRAVLANGIDHRFRRFSYLTDEGARVIVTLYGAGTLQGSTVDDNGVLNLVYDNTNRESRLIVHVQGGPGYALLRGIRDADVPPHSPAITGSDPIGNVNMRRLRLVNHGYINLTGGAKFLRIDQIGKGSTLELNDLPATTTTPPTTTITNVELIETTPPIPGVTFANVAVQVTTTTVTPPVPPISGFNLLTNQVGVNIPDPSAPVMPISGHDDPPPKPKPVPDPGEPLHPPQVATVNIDSNELVWFYINQYPTPADAADNAGLTIGYPVPGKAISLAPYTTTDNPHVSLGRYNGRQVVLVGDPDQNKIFAFNASTTAYEGEFSTANLFNDPDDPDDDGDKDLIKHMDGLGSTDTITVITSNGQDPTSDAVPGVNSALRLDITASIDAGVAVPIGDPFTPDAGKTERFQLTGGAAGLPGTETVFAVGAGHFDTSQPTFNQFGAVAMSVGRGTTIYNTDPVTEPAPKPPFPPAGAWNPALNPATDPFFWFKYNGIFQVGKAAFPGSVNAGPNGTIATTASPFDGFGSIDRFLAELTSGNPSITLREPSTLAAAGTIFLRDGVNITTDYPDPLRGLSESFHPELENFVIINVLGVTKRFKAWRAEETVINSLGILQFLDVHLAQDFTAVGRPIRHVDIPNRRGTVQLLSTARGTDRDDSTGGVTVIPSLRVVGPLAQPNKGPTPES